MLRQPATYDLVPYFFSDQYDVGKYAGFAPQWDGVVFRGDPASREFIAFVPLDALAGRARRSGVNCSQGRGVEQPFGTSSPTAR